MKELEFYLNTKVDGQYIFGGGQTDAEPVSFPFDNLEEFQAYYDGKTVTFPTTRAAMLVDMDFSGTEIGDLTFEQAAPDPLNPIPTKADQGTITSANPGAFIKDKVVASPATTGDITIDATKKTIAVEQEGAFSHIQAGDTLILGGADAGGAPPAGHAKAVYVERVSDDGRTIFLKEDTEFAAGDLNIATTPATDFTIGRSLPIGSTIELEGYDPMMDDAYTILGVSDDGTSLIVRTEENEFPANGTPVTHAQTTKSKIETNSYYKGDHLSINQRISDTKSLEIGINAEDAEFEKILRGLGILCQGNMGDERDPYAPNLASKVDPEQALNRTTQGMNLISDGLNHDTREQIEGPGDLTRALQDISLKQTLVDKVQKEQKQYVDLLGLKINDIENADPTEAVVNLQREQLALSISYSVMAQVNSMSLINYLN
jgi:flagellin-like hook-associated protein FlgL